MLAMSDPLFISVIIAATALAANLIQRIFGGGYGLSKALSAVETRLTLAIEGSRKEIDGRADAHARETAKTATALWDHVHQIELHMRDNYVRRGDFDEILRVNFSNITSRLERIEKNLDTKIASS